MTADIPLACTHDQPTRRGMCWQFPAARRVQRIRLHFGKHGGGHVPGPRRLPLDREGLSPACVSSTLPDSDRIFDTKDQVDPVRRLIRAASAWGGNPQKEAIYLNVMPSKNDGATISSGWQFPEAKAQHIRVTLTVILNVRFPRSGTSALGRQRPVADPECRRPSEWRLSR